ncbi:MAG: universal stress protein [Halothiobacillaceae bacterium]
MGRRGWRRLLLGSTAEEVARLAKTPVLLIRKP